jgi:hypothetical protein
MAVRVKSRVKKHRDALQKARMRPVQIWVPDMRHPDFAQECHRQSKVAAEADAADPGLRQFIDERLKDVNGWTE